ncbi:MAG: hypothetical protein IPP34_05150 [Bacteroidetes bacterium]|nr:hypothetical protein [Bacteroidota bacterium]
MYVYDNSKDTIIKNYDLFKEIQAVLPGIKSNNSDSLNFAPMPGSNFSESINFYSNNGGTIAGSIYFNEDKHQEDHKLSAAKQEFDDYIHR